MPINKSRAKRPSSLESAVSSKKTESLIAEDFVVRIALDIPGDGDIRTLPSEAYYVREALLVICNAPKETVVQFCGRAHRLLWPHDANPTKGTQINTASDNDEDVSTKAQIVMAPVDEPNQHIYVRYQLKKNLKRKVGEPFHFLECSGNPTTILTGNNVFPVTTADPDTGAIEALPSSSRETMHRVHRVHFEVLETLNAATTRATEPVFGPDTLDAIKRGDFEIIRVQHCCYLPTADVARFLQLICLLYAQPVYDAERITNLAEHLGLKVKTYTGKNNRVTGVMLQKLHGKKVVASLVFYDKKRRVAQMRQGKTLHQEEVDIVAKNVRFDMTLHGRGVEQIVGAARKDLAKRREVAPGLLSNAVSPEFFDNKPTTMASFEDAVTVLSHPPGGGVSKRQSFAPWLVRKCLHEFLRLGAVVRCTPAKLHAFTEVDDPVVKAWYEIGQAQKAPKRKSDAEGWTAPIIERSKLKKSAIYDSRKRLLDEHDIDIAIPYKFYADLEHHGPKSLIDAERREALNRALSKNADKDEVFRLLQEGIDNFFDQLVNVVGKTVSSPPTKLPLKEAGKPWTGSVDVQKKAPDRKSLRRQNVALNRKPRIGMGRSPGSRRKRKWSID